MSIVKKIGSIATKAMAGAIAVSQSVSTALAQEQGSVTIDTTAAGNAVDAVGQAVSGLITGKVMTNVLLVVGAGLAIAMIFMGIRWILRGGKAAAR